MTFLIIYILFIILLQLLTCLNCYSRMYYLWCSFVISICIIFAVCFQYLLHIVSVASKIIQTQGECRLQRTVTNLYLCIIKLSLKNIGKLSECSFMRHLGCKQKRKVILQRYHNLVWGSNIVLSFFFLIINIILIYFKIVIDFLIRIVKTMSCSLGIE